MFPSWWLALLVGFGLGRAFERERLKGRETTAEAPSVPTPPFDLWVWVVGWLGLTALFYAVFLAAFALYLVYRVSVRQFLLDLEPIELELLAIAPAVGLLAAFLGWIGMRLDRYIQLRRRVRQAFERAGQEYRSPSTMDRSWLDRARAVVRAGVLGYSSVKAEKAVSSPLD